MRHASELYNKFLQNVFAAEVHFGTKDQPALPSQLPQYVSHNSYVRYRTTAHVRDTKLNAAVVFFLKVFWCFGFSAFLLPCRHALVPLFIHGQGTYFYAGPSGWRRSTCPLPKTFWQGLHAQRSLAPGTHTHGRFFRRMTLRNLRTRFIDNRNV